MEFATSHEMPINAEGELLNKHSAAAQRNQLSGKPIFAAIGKFDEKSTTVTLKHALIN